jgi:hypothetical protein
MPVASGAAESAVGKVVWLWRSMGWLQAARVWASWSERGRCREEMRGDGTSSELGGGGQWAAARLAAVRRGGEVCSVVGVSCGCNAMQCNGRWCTIGQSIFGVTGGRSATLELTMPSLASNSSTPPPCLALTPTLRLPNAADRKTLTTSTKHSSHVTAYVPATRARAAAEVMFSLTPPTYIRTNIARCREMITTSSSQLREYVLSMGPGNIECYSARAHALHDWPASPSMA